MTSLRLEGRARKLGDDINTDYIIASVRKKETLDPKELSAFLFESVDPAFAASIEPGDVLVAGKNFGCGSAMEVAVSVPLAAGISAVLAKSFARTYYRNAINNGLIPIECDTEAIAEGDLLTIELHRNRLIVRNENGDLDLTGAPVMGVALDILLAGGLVPYIRQHGGFAT